MALQFLPLRWPLRFSKFNPSIKPSFNFSSSPSLSSKSCNKPSRATPFILQFDPCLRSLTALASSSQLETATEEAKETEIQEAEIPDRRRLLAQNIPWTCTAEDIRALFEKHGTVLDVELSMYNKTKKMNRGLAFVTMASEEEATVVLSSLESYDMDGRRLKIAYARSLKKSSAVEVKVPTQRCTVYVGNLAWRVTSEDLQQLFSSSAKVISARIIYQTKPRRPAGYGFVVFASKEEAEAAVSTFNGQEFMGRPLNLRLGKLKTGATNGIIDEVVEADEASKNEEVGN